MRLKKVTKINDVKKGSIILINRKLQPKEEIEIYKVQDIITSNDGLEVILQNKHNIFFNLNMYLQGISWVREACIVKP